MKKINGQSYSKLLIKADVLWDTLWVCSPRQPCELQCPKIRHAIISKQQHGMWPAWFQWHWKCKIDEESAPAPTSHPNKWSTMHTATEQPSFTTSKEADLLPTCCSWVPLLSLAAYTKSDNLEKPCLQCHWNTMEFQRSASKFCRGSVYITYTWTISEKGLSHLYTACSPLTQPLPVYF